MFLLDRFLVGGLGFVLDKVAQVVDRELDDEEVLRAQLLDLQLGLELGEIDEEEFAAQEADLLARLRVIQERRRGGRNRPIETGSLSEVEVSVVGDERER